MLHHMHEINSFMCHMIRIAPHNWRKVQVASAEEFAAKVNEAGGKCELHIYEGAGHAFLNKPDSKLLLLRPFVPS